MAKQRAKGWWYPWIFVGFFAVIITVNGIMMFFAFDSWTGLETKDHYLKGLAYDDNVAGAKAQAALGWKVNLTVDASESQGQQRNVTYKAVFLDHNNQPVEALKGHTFFVRPTSDGLDVDGPAQLTAPGVLEGQMAVSVPGQWDVRVHAVSKGRQYQHVERVVIK